MNRTPFLIMISALALPACRPDVEPRICDDVWFLDEDGDGFGDPWTEPLVACGPDCHFSATNALDCDDSDASTTALVEGSCPLDTFSDDDAYVSVQTPAYEYIVFYGTTPTVDPETARVGCQEWGGDLAAWPDAFAMADVTIELARTSIYAGYIGVEPNGEDGWRWQEESSMRLDQMWCDHQAPVPGGPEDRLALVKVGSTWCIGRPDSSPSVQGSQPYQSNTAHAICQRVRPFPETLE